MQPERAKLSACTNKASPGRGLKQEAGMVQFGLWMWRSGETARNRGADQIRNSVSMAQLEGTNCIEKQRRLSLLEMNLCRHHLLVKNAHDPDSVSV
jgi:hypothetical protein